MVIAYAALAYRRGKNLIKSRQTGCSSDCFNLQVRLCPWHCLVGLCSRKRITVYL